MKELFKGVGQPTRWGYQISGCNDRYQYQAPLVRSPIAPEVLNIGNIRTVPFFEAPAGRNTFYEKIIYNSLIINYLLKKKVKILRGYLNHLPNYPLSSIN
jgi:hypothetical protein